MSRRFDAPIEAVFDVFTNASRYPDYTPIRRVEMERLGVGAADGVGAIRALHFGPVPVRELVTDYEASRLFAFEVLSGAPVRGYRGRLGFDLGADGRTAATYVVELDPPLPGTGLAAAAGFRGAIEVLMRIAGPEAIRRVVRRLRLP